MKIDARTPVPALLKERDRACRNRRDPYARERLVKIDRLLAQHGLLVA